MEKTSQREEILSQPEPEVRPLVGLSRDLLLSWISRWGWAVWVTAASLAAIAFIAPRLSNYPAVSGDDNWIMSASYKLANQGVFGSELYAGFYNTEQVYFIALPVYHVLQAVVMRVAGAGVAEARSVALISGLLLLWCVAWLAYRWYGSAVSVVAVALLLLWQVELNDMPIGLPWLELSRWGRYDMTAAAFVWLTVVLLDQQLRRPNVWLAIGVGVSAGLATLSQFFGGFVLLVIGAALLWEWLRPSGPRLREVASQAFWVVFGWLVLIIPYVLYVIRHPKEFAGQAELKEGRADFHLPSFYMDNIRDESDRYRQLFEGGIPWIDGPLFSSLHPVGPIALIAVIAPALLVLLVRNINRRTIGDRLLLLSIVLFPLTLMLFDSTNASIYTIVFVPAIMITVAMAWTLTFRWFWRGLVSGYRAAAERRLNWVRVVVSAVFMVVLLLPLGWVLAEGVNEYRIDRRYSHTVADYREDFGAEIQQYLAPDAPVIGPDFVWWSLGDHPYRSISNVFLRWQSEFVEGETTSFVPVIKTERAGYILFGGHAWSILENMPEEQEEPIRSFLWYCTEHVGTIDSSGYDRIMVFEVLPDSRARPQCR